MGGVDLAGDLNRKIEGTLIELSVTFESVDVHQVVHSLRKSG